MAGILLVGYLGLGTSYSGSVFNEISGGGYARKAVTLASPDGVALTNTAGLTFGPDLGSAWGSITWTALFDAPSGGNALLVWPQRMPPYVAASGTVTVGAGSIQLVLPQIIQALTGGVFSNFPAGSVLGSVGGTAGVVAGTGLSVGSGVMQAFVATGLQPARNLTDLANPALARVTINQGDVVLAFAPVVATDCSTGNVFNVTLAGNAQLGAPANLRAGASYIWRLMQDPVGGRALTFASCFKFASGAAPSLTATPSATDILSALSDGVNVYAALMKDMR
jgi:hypothetical protein